MVLHFLTVGATALLAPPSLVHRACRHSEPRMGMFDGFAAAFANDDSLGEKQGGLKSKQELRTITWQGPKGEITSQAVPGQKLKDIARQEGIGPIKYSCNEVAASPRQTRPWPQPHPQSLQP